MNVFEENHNMISGKFFLIKELVDNVVINGYNDEVLCNFAGHSLPIIHTIIDWIDLKKEYNLESMRFFLQKVDQNVLDTWRENVRKYDNLISDYLDYINLVGDDQ